MPGPRSKAIFDREAEAMAPGLQSIALYSQIVVDRARGCTITDVDGNEYLDFIAGIAVGSLGHCHPHYVKRLKEQLDHVTFGSFTTENRARFLNLVGGLLPEGITHIQLFSGGAEAVEAAFRLAKSVSKKFEFIGFWGGYHGKTAGVIGLLGGAYRNHQGPFPPGMHLTPYANCYRCPWKLEYPSCGLACAEHLRNVIKNDTQGEVAAIIVEPMQGTAGNVIPPDDFIRAVREIADECGALLIADEILTGFGRTGTMWASEQFGLKPDIMTIGKGMGGGFPLSAVASSYERMSAKPFGEPSGSSSSYGGNPLAAAAGLAAVEVILEEKLIENSARVGALMLDALKRLHGQIPLHRRCARTRPHDRRRDGRRPQDQGAAWTRPSPAPCSMRRWSAALSRCRIRTSFASTRPSSSPRKKRCAALTSSTNPSPPSRAASGSTEAGSACSRARSSASAMSPKRVICRAGDPATM